MRCVCVAPRYRCVGERGARVVSSVENRYIYKAVVGCENFTCAHNMQSKYNIYSVSYASRC